MLSQTERSLSAALVAKLPRILGIVFLTIYAIRLLGHFDLTWDVMAYHLPFSAKRASVPYASSFVLSRFLEQRYLGFPPLAEYVTGGLWRAFGIPQAGNLINPIAIGTLGLYVDRFNGVPLVWTVLLFVAVPCLHTELASQYVDLWTNAFFSLFLMAANNFLTQTRSRSLHFWVACIGLLISVESKPQFIVIGTVGAALFLAALLYARFHSSSKQCVSAVGMLRYCIYFTALIPLIFASPIVNTIRFGNPIYPVSVRWAAYSLPGTEDDADAYLYYGPTYLRQSPNWEKWMLSILEYRALSMRPGGYTLGQGDVVQGSESDRMGGSALPLIVVAVCLAVVATKRLPNRSVVVRPVLSMCALTLVASFCPGSLDLRYFSFIQIIIVLASLSILYNLMAQGDVKAAGMMIGLRAAIVGSAVFISMVTGLAYVWPPHLDVNAVTNVHRQQLMAALDHSTVICYAKHDPYAILYSRVLNADIPIDYKLVDVSDPIACPAGSFILH